MFLVALLHFYKRVCPSIRLALRPLDRRSITPSLWRVLGASYAEHSALFFYFTILLESIKAPISLCNYSETQPNFNFLYCFFIYIILAFFCRQAQHSSSNRLEMRGKRVEPLEIENVEKMRFLSLHLHSLINSINFLFLLVTTINFFGFVIGHDPKDEMQSIGW